MDFCGWFKCKHKKELGIEIKWRVELMRQVQRFNQGENSMREYYQAESSMAIERVRKEQLETVRMYEELIAKLKKGRNFKG